MHSTATEQAIEALSPLKPYLTIQETADLLNVNVKLVRKLIKSGELAHLRLGDRLYRIPASALAPLVAGGQQ